MMNFSEFFEQYVLINLHVRVWTASRNNSPKDLGLDNVKIASEVASLGGKSVFDKQKIKFMNQIKHSAEALLSDAGFPCMGGWAVEKTAVQKTVKALEEYQSEYYQKRNTLLVGYKQECEDWIKTASELMKDIPNFGDAIRQSLYSEEYIRDQVSFSFSVNDNMLNDPVGDSALQMIADMASKSLSTFQNSMAKGHSFTRRSLSYLLKIREKLATLALVDSFVQPAIDKIDQFEAKWPTGSKQSLDPNLMSDLMGMLSLLANQKYLNSLRSSSLAVDNTVEDDDLSGSLNSQPLDDSEDDFLAGILALTGQAPADMLHQTNEATTLGFY